MIACTLDECPPGLFIFGNCLGFKSEYRTLQGASESYLVSSGEFFWGGANNPNEQGALMVTPVELVDAAALRLKGIVDEDD